MLEDLNTVHGLTKEIERLRAGEEKGWSPEMESTPGQLWKRLLDSEPEKRIATIRKLLESANDGARCAMDMHIAELLQQRGQLASLQENNQRWTTTYRLITTFIATLRRDRQGVMERGGVADKLELFLGGGINPVGHEARRILCGHRWSEGGRDFECAEIVGPDGLHQGEHYAYVRQGSAADEELRMSYLEEENDELRKRLGLPPNQRRS